MIKSKTCKGINKAKNFKGCGKLTTYRTYGLCESCLREWSKTDEGFELYVKPRIIPKAKKDVKEQKELKDKELRYKIKKLSEFEAEAKTVFQKWVRLRDQDKPCVSCNTHSSEIWDGGHFYKAEIYSGLIFDERNVHKQCRKCNSFLGGNENNYRLGLIERFGRPFVLQLDADAIKLRQYKYTKQQLIDIKKHYQTKIKQNDFTETENPTTGSSLRTDKPK